MANTVYNSETIKLQNNTEVTLAPLAIGLLRRFMKAWGEFGDIKEDDDAFDIYINCAGIALSKQLRDDFPEPFDSEKTLKDDYREHLEEILDMDTIFKVLEVCGGLKLNDPKLLEAAEAAVVAADAALAAADGKN